MVPVAPYVQPRSSWRNTHESLPRHGQRLEAGSLMYKRIVILLIIIDVLLILNAVGV